MLSNLPSNHQEIKVEAWGSNKRAQDLLNCAFELCVSLGEMGMKGDFYTHLNKKCLILPI
jgi:hypothetical protein